MGQTFLYFGGEGQTFFVGGGGGYDRCEQCEQALQGPEIQVSNKQQPTNDNLIILYYATDKLVSSQ